MFKTASGTECLVVARYLGVLPSAAHITGVFPWTSSLWTWLNLLLLSKTQATSLEMKVEKRLRPEMITQSYCRWNVKVVNISCLLLFLHLMTLTVMHKVPVPSNQGWLSPLFQNKQNWTHLHTHRKKIIWDLPIFIYSNTRSNEGKPTLNYSLT